MTLLPVRKPDKRQPGDHYPLNGKKGGQLLGKNGVLRTLHTPTSDLAMRVFRFTTITMHRVKANPRRNLRVVNNSVNRRSDVNGRKTFGTMGFLDHGVLRVNVEKACLRIDTAALVAKRRRHANNRRVMNLIDRRGNHNHVITRVTIHNRTTGHDIGTRAGDNTTVEVMITARLNAR